jgi:hypothetical protein
MTVYSVRYWGTFDDNIESYETANELYRRAASCAGYTESGIGIYYRDAEGLLMHLVDMPTLDAANNVVRHLNRP